MAEAFPGNFGGDARATWLQRHGMLLLIAAFYSFASLDRAILSLLVDPIRSDLSLSDGQFGLIIGFGFLGPQFLLALPAARIVDRGSRRLIALFTVTIWSGATLLSGLAASASQLLLCRTAVGIGESSNSVYPSLVSDLYDKNRRALAIGVYYAASGLIGIACFSIGGWIAQYYGWRWTLVAAGLPGLLLVLVAYFFMVDPPRGGAEGRSDDGRTPTFREAFAFLATQRTYLLVVAGNFVFGLGFGTMVFWYPAFLTRVHGLTTSQAGFYVGMSMGLAGAAGYLLGGWLVGRLVKRDERWRAGLPTLAMFLFVPLVLIGASTASAGLAITAFGLAFLLQAAMLSGMVALVQSVLRPRMRGTGAALFNMLSGLSAVAIAPAWSGYLNDHLQPYFGQEAVRYSLFSGAVAALCTAMIYFFSCNTLERDVRRAEEA